MMFHLSSSGFYRRFPHGKESEADQDAEPDFPLEPRRRVENFEEKKTIG
jgi:hypothetical protein